ncbi:MAG TPA: hypothetical protein EYP55_11420 [Anaerolineae bacterium]|nr:hypothetical protein [Anaerolineae bacterium]
MKRWISAVNILALLSGCLTIAAMLFPWWSLALEFGGETDLYPYLISGPGSELLGYKRSPQMTLLTGVLISCILLCFAGSVLRGRIGRAALGAAGILVLLATWRLLVRVARVAARFHIPIQGRAVVTYEGFAPVEVSTRLRPGLYLIVLAGVLCLVASVFHNKLRLRSE